MTVVKRLMVFGTVLVLTAFVAVSAAETQTSLVHSARGPESKCIFAHSFECPLVPEVLSATGLVLDYWTLSPISGELVISVAPPLIDISSGAGEYALDGFEPGSNFVIKALRAPPGYRETNNVERMIGDKSVEMDVYVAAEADLLRQFSVIGIVQQLDTAIVIAEMLDSGGLPLEGVSFTDVRLTDESMSSIGEGPYYFGIAGDIVDQIALSLSTAYMGRGARVAFLNVPPGPATLTIYLPAPQANITSEFIAEPDVVHLLEVQ